MFPYNSSTNGLIVGSLHYVWMSWGQW